MADCTCSGQPRPPTGKVLSAYSMVRGVRLSRSRKASRTS